MVVDRTAPSREETEGMRGRETITGTAMMGGGAAGALGSGAFAGVTAMAVGWVVGFLIGMMAGMAIGESKGLYKGMQTPGFMRK
jgi:hypothetical protein